MDFHGIKNFGITELKTIYAIDSTGIVIYDHTGSPKIIIETGGVGINLSPGMLDPSVVFDVNGNMGVNGYIKGVANGTQPDHAVNKSQLDSVSGGAAGGVEGDPLTYDSTTQLIGFAYDSSLLGIDGDGELYVKESSIDHGSISGLGDNDHDQYKQRQSSVITNLSPDATDVQYSNVVLASGNVNLPKCSDVGQMVGELTIINDDSTNVITVTPDVNDKIFDKSPGNSISSPGINYGESITLIVLDSTINAGRWGIKSTAGDMWT